jgi:hypothetical protein
VKPARHRNSNEPAKLFPARGKSLSAMLSMIRSYFERRQFDEVQTAEDDPYVLFTGDGNFYHCGHRKFLPGEGSFPFIAIEPEEFAVEDRPRPTRE